MAKERCQICGQSKAKRNCRIKDHIRICPVCCATLRSGQCENCTYYESSLRYESERPQKERRFITEIHPEIDEECDRILKLIESGQLSSGKKQMGELYKKYPDYHTVLYGMGVCNALQENFEEAIQFFKKAVAVFPYLTEAHFNMAAAYIKLADIAGVVREFKEVIRLGRDPELVSEAKRRLSELDKDVREINGFDLNTYVKNSETFGEAFAALEKREFKLAIDLFQRVLAIDPKHVQSWGNLGLAYAGLGEKEKALDCLDKALEIDPGYEIAAVNRIAIEELKPAGRFEGRIDSVHYYRDYKFREKKSYIAEALGKGGLFRK